MTSRILIVDDHQIVRQGIRTLLEKLRPEWEICGEAVNGAQAIDFVRDLKPDLVVMDITMPGMSGIDAVARMRKLGLGCPVLMFTMHQSSRLAIDVKQAGAQGYALKSQAVQDLVRAIDALLTGGTFFGGPPEPAQSQEKKPAKDEKSSAPNRGALSSSFVLALM
jgi:DNA-binding NarL/FixJ family response regulator